VDDGQRAGEQVPPDGDVGAGVAARHFVGDPVVGDDVVGGDLAGLGDDEAVGELRVVGGEPERARIGLEAGERRSTAERLMWLLVIAVVEEVGES
jgi:hypothetical protein